MKKHVRWITCLLLLLLLSTLSACSTTDSENNPAMVGALIGNEQVSTHQKRLSDVETPYTLCYQNADGSVSLYIFSSPIAYWDEEGELQMIDTSLTPVAESS